MSRQPTCTIFVGNLPFDITESALTDILSQAGPVKNLRLVNDRETGRFKGFGFCEYYDKATAESAHRNLNNMEISGRPIRIDYAEDFDTKMRSYKEQRGDGDGGLGRRDGGGDRRGPGVQGGSGGSIGYAAASVSASQVAALIGGTPASARETQEQLNKVFAAMTRGQLWEVMRDLKATVCHDKAAAKQFFLERPGLAKALFQAQVLLGMVKPPAIVLQEPTPPLQQPPVPAGYAAAEGTAGSGYPGRRSFPSPAHFQEGPMGLGGRSAVPGTVAVPGQPQPPPPPRTAGGPMALQPPPPPRPLNPAAPLGVQQPMQVLVTQDGQQVVLPGPQIGLQAPGMVQLQQAVQPQPQLQPLQLQGQPAEAGGAPAAPTAAGAQAPAVAPGPGGDQTAALLRQVVSMSDEQINALPPEYRTQVLFVKEQIRLGAINVT